MLDRAKVLKALELAKQDLFNDHTSLIHDLAELWNGLCSDTYMQERLQPLLAQHGAPTWLGKIDAMYQVNGEKGEYSVISVDGSQIYPDRHQGTVCHLINLGIASFTYEKAESKVRLSCEPYIFTQIDDQFESSIDHVNARRQKLELEMGYQYAAQLKKEAANSLLFLFDGALIFWHLQSKEQEFKRIYLTYYMQALEQFYQATIPIAGYISLPKNKGLIDVLIAYQEHSFQVSETIKEGIDQMAVQYYLPEMHRSTIFYDNAPIAREYPQHLRPCFFYMNTSYEIARVEIPCWVAQNQQLLDQVSSLMYDQLEKGRGYPVCIAEAHEQAVVKGPDREFFYHLIQKLSIEQKRFLLLSKKSQRKKYIGF